MPTVSIDFLADFPLLLSPISAPLLSSVLGLTFVGVDCVAQDGGRLRFIDVSVAHEELMGLLEYHNVKSEAKLMPESSPEYQVRS